MDSTDTKLRKLARSSHWQNLYSSSKEINSVYLFDNTINFSGIQLRFLYWLSIYAMLTEEIMKHEDDWLSKAVIEDDDRTDAYLIYRNKKYDFLWKKHRREEKLAEHKSKHKNKHKSGQANLIDVDLRREG